MIYRNICGIKMSAVCMGCWNISGDATWGGQDEKDSINAINEAVSRGINFFDTAEAYGSGYSEELLGRVLSPARDKVVIATKTSRIKPRELAKACEESLRRLRTDYVDVYYIHWPDPEVPMEDTVAAIEKLKEEGKIRVPAVSNFGERDLSEILKLYPVKINQIPYNLLFRAVEYGVRRLCFSKGVQVAAYSPIAEGLLSGKFACADEVPEGRARTRHFSSRRPMARHGEEGFEEETFRAIGGIKILAGELSVSMAELALAWLLHQEGVGFVVAGARNAAQARMNAMAAEIKLAPEITGRLEAITAPLKEKMGRNPDMWQSEPRMK